jgi:hypothetical protein
VDLARVTRGEMLAAVGGLVFLLAMFALEWFSAASTGGGQLGGWASFAFPLDLLLFVGGVLPVGHAVLRAAGVIPGQPPAPRGQAVVGAGAVVSVLVLVRLIAPPGDTDAEFGAFVALLAGLSIAAGGYLAIREHLAGRAA